MKRRALAAVVLTVTLLSFRECSRAEDAKQYWDLGIAQVHKGQYKNAIPYFDKAIAIDPTDPKFFFQRAYANYATWGADRLENPNSKALDNALADFGKVIELTPDSAEAYYNRGVIYGLKAQSVFAFHEPKDMLLHAQDDYAKAIALDPKMSKAQTGLDDIHKRLSGLQAEVEKAKSTRSNMHLTICAIP